MREGFALGPFFIHYYGIIIMLGALAAAWLAGRIAARQGEDPEIIWDFLPWTLIGGIIGARIWHILTPSSSDVAQGLTTGYYLTHPLDAIAIWKGGLGIPGAVMGGALAVYIYSRIKKVYFLTWIDIIAPGLALAQAIGRWGNFVNQELYGLPSDMPWAIYIDPLHRIPGFESFSTYHPLFLYESLWNLINMVVLLWIGRRFVKHLKTGDIFLTYMIIYPFGRFMLEFLRLDESKVAGINANQTMMVIIVAVATVILVVRHKISNTQENNIVE